MSSTAPESEPEPKKRCVDRAAGVENHGNVLGGALAANTAVIQGALWLLGKDGKPERQLALPQGFGLVQLVHVPPVTVLPPGHPEGTDMIPSRLQGCVVGLLNKHLKIQPLLAEISAFAVQRWIKNYELMLANLVEDEQKLDERRQRQDALRHKEADDIGHAERVKYIQEEAIRGKKHLDQVYEAGEPAAAP